MPLVEQSCVYDAASNRLLVTCGKSLPFSGSQFSSISNGDNNSCLGKVREFISPGADVQPQEKQLKERVKGEGCGTAGAVAWGLRSPW